MLGGLAALGVGLLVVMVGLFGGFGRPKESLESRIEAYTRQGRGQARSLRSPAAAGRDRPGGRHGQPGAEEQPRASRPSSATGSRPRAWRSSPPSGCSSTPASRSAPPRSASLLTGGNLLMALLGLAVGAFVPWACLGFKRSRRLKAFNGQLAG